MPRRVNFDDKVDSEINEFVSKHSSIFYLSKQFYHKGSCYIIRIKGRSDLPNNSLDVHSFVVMCTCYNFVMYCVTSDPEKRILHETRNLKTTLNKILEII